MHCFTVEYSRSVVRRDSDRGKCRQALHIISVVVVVVEHFCIALYFVMFCVHV